MDQRATLASRLAEDDIRADVARGNRDGHPASAYPMDDWTVVLRRGERSLPISWWTGRGLSEVPTARDVLARLLSEAADVGQGDDFAGWCQRHGLDQDERQHRGRYQAIVRQTEKLRMFLGERYESYLLDTNFDEDPALGYAASQRPNPPETGR